MSLYLSPELSGVAELTQRVGRAPYLEELLTRETAWGDLLKHPVVEDVERDPPGDNKRFKPANELGEVLDGERVVLCIPC